MTVDPARPLLGETAVISGGLGDIGSAIARELARCGADVAVGDLRRTEADDVLAAAVAEHGRRFRSDVVDVADAAEVRHWVADVEAELGTPTLIIPAAAIVGFAGVRTAEPERWRHELAVNLDGAFHLAQAGALRLLASGRRGRIVFVGSWAGHAPHPHVLAYSVSKAALRMMCKCLALELAPAGILVNEVAPGYVDGGLARDAYASDPSLRDRASSQVPVNRLVQPRDVALQVAHLCGPGGQQITGTTIVVDGGLTLVSAFGFEGEP